MIDGIYSASSGMRAQQNQMDALASDLANVNTTGYKRTRFGFQDLLYQQMGDNRAITQESRIGAGVGGAAVDRDMAVGQTQRTDQPFDLAIDGAGFFQVRTRDGRVALTRDGSFQLDSQGQLTTSGGLPLIPGVRIPTGVDHGNVKINADGAVTVDGRRLGQVTVVTVTTPQRLESAGENLYLPTAGSGGPVAQGGGRIQQGALEGSNVDVAQAMSDMVQSQRAYELSSRAIRTWDDLLSTATQIRR